MVFADNIVRSNLESVFFPPGREFGLVQELVAVPIVNTTEEFVVVGVDPI